MLPFRLHPLADAEAIEAAEWIRDDNPYQAALFVKELEEAIKKARRQPGLYSYFDGEFRKIRVGKFTYALVYRVRKDEIQIIAVMHLHRKPGYWKSRDKTWST
ncbi:MAG: type II toxin-antitoxin system RelE/ParE family toxin [Verrucomicrobiota bacterium]